MILKLYWICKTPERLYIANSRNAVLLPKGSRTPIRCLRAAQQRRWTFHEQCRVLCNGHRNTCSRQAKESQNFPPCGSVGLAIWKYQKQMGISMIHPPGNPSPHDFGHMPSLLLISKAHVNQAEDRHVRKKCNNSMLKRKDPQILSH